ncbi:immunity protein YezG family protein [Metasolibacillus sp. FSL K6-0083]|uniref:immunity protein YezG family protein n=1 Tax=Metasolibacillus sp. FSL K6-0083 TaxID=2921416 RepID=UPI00315A1AF6
MEQEMNRIYQKIAEIVNKMIPEEWESFHYYAQISATGGGTYFFYNTSDDKKKFMYSLSITSYFNVDEEEFAILEKTLFKLSEELRDIFIHYGQEPWYSFTLSLDRNGKFKINYDYTNWFETDYRFSKQITIWKYKYLGIIPTDEKQKDLIQKYLEEYPDNPI